MWIAENTSGNRIYCVKTTKSEVIGWLNKHFPFDQFQEIFWKQGDLIPYFSKPENCMNSIRKERGMALPEPLIIRKLTKSEQQYLKRAISKQDRSFFDA